MNKKYNRSLRYKLMMIIIGLPTIGMLVYSSMAINLFVNDKKAYILDSAVTVSKALATLVKSEIHNFDRVTYQIFESIDKNSFICPFCEK